MIASILGLTLYVLAIVLILDLSPRRVTEDLLQIITPHQTLHERIKAIRGGKRKKGIYYKLMAIKQALEATGKHKQFTFICFASLVLFAAGIFLSILIDNLFLLPALSAAFALIPFLYTANTISSYEKKTKEELETTLSIITTSYIRSDDIIGAIRENIPYPVDVSATAESRIKGLIAIRDSVRQLIEYQTEDFPESFIAAEQTKLNNLYDEFSKKYGLINSRANTSAFSADSSYCLLASLEILDDEGNFVRKADMFTKRTIRQKVVVTSVDTASEALALSLAEKARIDIC